MFRSNSINLEFTNWKYAQIDDYLFTKYGIKEDNVCNFTEFVIDFFNIRQLIEYLNELDIYNSFGIVSETLN